MTHVWRDIKDLCYPGKDYKNTISTVSQMLIVKTILDQIQYCFANSDTVPVCLKEIRKYHQLGNVFAKPTPTQQLQNVHLLNLYSIISHH